MTTAIVINGASGRMGRALVQACVENDGTRLAAALVRSGSEYEGADAGTVAGIAPAGITMLSERNQLPDDLNVWIDFTLPEGLMDALGYCVDNKIPMVIGRFLYEKDRLERSYVGLLHSATRIFAPLRLSALQGASCKISYWES